MESPETATIKCTPRESRKKLIEMIEERGTVGFKDVIAFRRKEGLYFGPTDDTFDVLFTNQALGNINIDLVNNTVSKTNHTLKKD